MKSASLVNRVAGVAVLALAVASPALAQQGAAGPKGAARLDSLEGNVLVGGATGLATGTKGQVLPDGTRVLTTAKGRAVVKYEDGCEVRLEPNQRFVVSRDRPCEALLLLVQGTVPPPVAPPTGLAGAAMTGDLQAAALFGATAAGVAIWYNRDDSGSSVSPN